MFDKVLNNIKKLDHIEILVKVLNKREVKKFIIFLNTEKQLRLGLDSKDDILGLYKSFSYASEKKSAGGRAPFGVIDLHVDGDYYKTYKVTVFNNGDFEITSNTVKPDRNLRDIVGISQNIEGLTEKNFDLFIEFITPIYAEETRKAILQ